jgi:hypothetical protein
LRLQRYAKKKKQPNLSFGFFAALLATRPSVFAKDYFDISCNHATLTI